MEINGNHESNNDNVITELQAIKTNTANIKVEAESVNLNTDTLETLTSAGNNTLSSIDNKVILPSVLNSDQLKVNDSAVIGSLATMNNNFHSQTDFLDASVDALTNQPTTSKMQLSQDVPLQFQMATNNTS